MAAQVERNSEVTDTQQVDEDCVPYILIGKLEVSGCFWITLIYYHIYNFKD